MHLSDRGADFIARHEGFVSRAYRDPVGVLTIGTGFTNRSKAFRSYWLRTRGHDLRPGDTITRDENAKILATVADAEYGAAVNRAIRPQKQHHYDGATSVAFNLGPASVKWRWGRALAAGDIAGCARLLRSGYNKAGGRVLKGLTIRRGHEARLIEHGDYGDGGAARFGILDHLPADDAGRQARKDQLADYQRHLKALGFDPGPADGLWGKRTRSAVLAFQKDHVHLVNDGILGPATRAGIDRAVAARGAGKGPLLGTAGLALVSGAAVKLEADWSGLLVGGGGLALVVMAGYLAWRYRDELRHWGRGLWPS